MSISLEQFLDQTAKRGSWYGGGSASALTGALAAALLEKLLSRPQDVKPVRALRNRCFDFVERDATAFARVIEAYYQHDYSAAKLALKEAIEVPVRVYAVATRVLTTAKRLSRSIRPQYRSDLRCAMSLASASRTSARAFIVTNLKWLGDPAHARRIERRLARVR